MPSDSSASPSATTLTRPRLAPGEKRVFRFELSPRDLSSVSPEGEIRALRGRYTVFVGGGQPGSGPAEKQSNFMIDAAMKLPD